ncbi:MAG: YlxR family protein [archaeon]
MKTRKIPLRMCTGCGISKPKKELIRIVKNSEGEISLDFTGKKQGRGAYVCFSMDCLKKAKKTKRVERAFECAIPEAVYLALESEMEKGE